MEAFFRTANYPLVESSDMSAEVREEALDVCLLACEKHSADMEKCTQVRFHCCSATGAWLRMQQLRLGAVLALCNVRCARLEGAPLSCHMLAAGKPLKHTRAGGCADTGVQDVCRSSRSSWTRSLVRPGTLWPGSTTRTRSRTSAGTCCTCSSAASSGCCAGRHSGLEHICLQAAQLSGLERAAAALTGQPARRNLAAALRTASAPSAAHATRVSLLPLVK